MNTKQPLIIYISAASDLMSERESLGRLIAELPVDLSWRILQTPLEADLLDLRTLQQADLHFLIMGGDIRAPVGLEWRMANYAGRRTIPFLKQDVPRTPAGLDFIRETRIGWRPFTDPADLTRQVRLVVADHLLQRAVELALTPLEVERLQSLQGQQTTATSKEGGSEAGRSAVILSRERYEPDEGVLIEPAGSEFEKNNPPDKQDNS